MNESTKLTKDYYFTLHEQQIEIIESQKQNLKLLTEENQRIAEEIQQNRILLEEGMKVKKKLFIFIKIILRRRKI